MSSDVKTNPFQEPSFITMAQWWQQHPTAMIEGMSKFRQVMFLACASPYQSSMSDPLYATNLLAHYLQLFSGLFDEYKAALDTEVTAGATQATDAPGRLAGFRALLVQQYNAFLTVYNESPVVNPKVPPFAG